MESLEVTLAPATPHSFLFDTKTVKLTVNNVPKYHTVDYVAKDAKGNFYVVHLEEDANFEEGTCLNVGRQDNVAQTTVQRTNTFRDGGSIEIYFIQDGERRKLFIPTLTRVGEQPHISNSKTRDVEPIDIILHYEMKPKTPVSNPIEDMINALPEDQRDIARQQFLRGYLGF